jgi:hypothetical protein
VFQLTGTAEAKTLRPDKAGVSLNRRKSVSWLVRRLRSKQRQQRFLKKLPCE